MDVVKASGDPTPTAARFRGPEVPPAGDVLARLDILVDRVQRPQQLPTFLIEQSAGQTLESSPGTSIGFAVAP